MSTEPYLAPRLKILREFSESEAFAEWHRYIAHYTADAGLPDLKEAAAKKKPAKQPKADTTKLQCAACGEAMRVPSKLLAGDKPVNVRCPNPDCRKVLRVKPQATKKPAKPNAQELKAEKARAKAKLTCVSCNNTMMINRSDLAGDAPVNVRCPNPDCGEILTIKPKPRKEPNKNPERGDLTAD